MKKYLLFFTIILPIFSYAQTKLVKSTPVEVYPGLTGAIWPRISENGNITWGRNGYSRIYYSRPNGSTFITDTVNKTKYQAFMGNWTGQDVAGDFLTYSTQPAMVGKVFLQKYSGTKYGDTVRVVNTGTSIPRFPGIAIDKNGNPVVFYMNITSTMKGAHYEVVPSTDGGKTFNAGINSAANDSGDVCDCCPAAMAISGDTWVILYRNAYKDIRDIRANISYDDGKTFSTQIDLDTTDWFLNSCPSSAPDAIIVGDTLVTVFMSGASGVSKVYLTAYDLKNKKRLYTRLLFKPPSGLFSQNYPLIAGDDKQIGVVFNHLGSKGNDVVLCWSNHGISDLFNHADTLTGDVSGYQERGHLVLVNNVFKTVFLDQTTGKIWTRDMALSGTTSITTSVLGSKLRVFPQPVHDILNVEIDGNKAEVISINILDITGRILLHEEGLVVVGKNHFELNTSSLLNGIYFLKVEGKNSKEVLKLSKE